MKYLLTILAMFAPCMAADPCGMVPPVIRNNRASELERDGIQRTYVFYKDGVETFAVRPGFVGNVDNFGMLIPVPSMPVINKIADDTFAHIEAAIKPPSVTVDLTPVVYTSTFNSPLITGFSADTLSYSSRMNFNMVRLLKEEAVGMYQVAVLEAGSSEALELWMTDHGYQYPKGMDSVCKDYVDQGWLFVAVKAKVGSKNNVEPRPGMTSADATREAGSQFSGHVQGMSFRFRSDELVVPMRLSSYNPGDTHNVVYVLTDKPTAIKDIPHKFVKKQISGEELYLNLTQPVPLRIIGGDYYNIPKATLERVVSQRDPKQYNGHAAELFAADLMALHEQGLELESELLEKQLLRISERLNLRGPEMDKLHKQAIQEKLNVDINLALVDLLGMTLTVIDGDFPRETLRRDNLHFISYEKMVPKSGYVEVAGGRNPDDAIIWVDESARATALSNARKLQSMNMSKRIELGESAPIGPVKQNVVAPITAPLGMLDSLKWAGLGLIIVLLCCSVLLLKRKSGLAVLLLAVGAFGASCTAKPSASVLPINKVKLQELRNENKAEAAASELSEAVDVGTLTAAAKDNTDFQAQGWAIVGLSELENEDAWQALDSADSAQNSELVRVWAQGAMVNIAETKPQLDKCLVMCAYYPALIEPMKKKLPGNTEGLDLRSLMAVAQEDGWLRASSKSSWILFSGGNYESPLNDLVLCFKPEQFIELMFNEEDFSTSRSAASYLATKGQNDPEGVAKLYLEAIKPDVKATEFPWGNNTLYAPSINWPKDQELVLVSSLIEWAVWAEAKGYGYGAFGRIQTVIFGTSFVTGGFCESLPEWIEKHGHIIGRDALDNMLKRHGLNEKKRFVEALGKMK